jgi:hypothetical protein
MKSVNKFFFVEMLAMMMAFGMILAGCEQPPTGGSSASDYASGTDGTDGAGGTDGTSGGEVISVGETIGPLTVKDISTALAGLPANTATNPHIVKLDSSVIIDTSDTSSEGYSLVGGILQPAYTGVWATINRTVGDSGKYVFLDLSECSAKGNLIRGPLFSPSSPQGYEMNIIKSNQYIKGITLPARLASIGNNAFYGCASLSSVVIPQGVADIGDDAFSLCSGLTIITVPAGLADEFDDAYYGGTSARLNVVLTGPGSVADDAFNNRTYLVSVTIGKGVTNISADTFDGCANLAAVNVDETNIDYSSEDGIMFSKDKTVFYYYPRALSGSYSIPSGVVSIGDNAFYNCIKLTGPLVIPSGVTSIGSGAFYNCTGLTGPLVIPSGVASIESGAFYNCIGLTSVTIPVSVASIGAYSFSSSGSGGIISFSRSYGAFENCAGLTRVTIPAKLTADFVDKFTGYSNLELTLTGTDSIPNRALDRKLRVTDGKYYDCTEIIKVTIEDGVASIGQYAFYGCTGLTNVSIAAEVIGQSAFSGCTGITDIAVGAGVNSFYSDSFDGCANLEQITVAPSNPTYSSSQGIWYNNVRHSVALVPQKISGSITIPSGITSIGDNAFEGRTGLTGVNIPYSVAVIGERAFAGCIGLASIFIPNSLDEWLGWLVETGQHIPIVDNFTPRSDTIYIDGVSTIKPYAFDGCANLTSVTFGGRAIFDHDRYERQKLWDAVTTLIGLFSPSVIDGQIQIPIGDQIQMIRDATGLVFDVKDNSIGAEYEIGFYGNAFPQGSSGAGGNALKAAYLDRLSGGEGAYTRTAGGSDWKLVKR